MGNNALKRPDRPAPVFAAPLKEGADGISRGLVLDQILYPEVKRIHENGRCRDALGKWARLALGWLWMESEKGTETVEITRLGLATALHTDMDTIDRCADSLEQAGLIKVTRTGEGKCTRERKLWHIAVSTGEEKLGRVLECDDSGAPRGEYLLLPAPAGREAFSGLPYAIVWGWAWLRSNYGRSPFDEDPSAIARFFGTSVSRFKEVLTRLSTDSLCEWSELDSSRKGLIRIAPTRDLNAITGTWRVK